MIDIICPKCNKPAEFNVIVPTSKIYTRYGGNGMFRCGCGPNAFKLDFRYIVNENDEPVIFNLTLDVSDSKYIEYSWLKGNGWDITLDSKEILAEESTAAATDCPSPEQAWELLKRYSKLLAFA